MIVSARVSEKMSELGISQSELARRVGVAQPTIYKLLRSSKKGSAHLHKIARELGTTPAYLTGETDDPEADAPAEPELDAEQRDLVTSFGALDRADRRAFSHIVRALARSAAPAPLPERRALAAMFRVMLEQLPPELDFDRQADLLAEWLPASMAQLVDIVPEDVAAEPPAPALAGQDRGSRS